MPENQPANSGENAGHLFQPNLPDTELRQPEHKNARINENKIT
jgi:hypothetical protein